MCGIKSYCCQGEGMILERGDTWTVQDNILRDGEGEGGAGVGRGDGGGMENRIREEPCGEENLA